MVSFSQAGLTAGTHHLSVSATNSIGQSAGVQRVFVMDAAPSAPIVSIYPASPTSVDDCVAVLDTASVDPEGGFVMYTYTWQRMGDNGLVVEDMALSNTYTARDEVWELSVIGSDSYGDSEPGIATVTIQNAAPTVGDVFIEPEDPYVGQTVTCTYEDYEDVDGDGDASAIFWWAGEDYIGQGPEISSGFVRDDVLTCEVIPSDGESVGTAVTENVTVANAPPVVTLVSLLPDPIYTDSMVTPEISGVDGDVSDVLTYSYVWYVETQDVGVSLDELDGSYFVKDEEVSVGVTPFDGLDYGETVWSTSVLVQNSEPTEPGVTIYPLNPVVGEDELLCEVTTESEDADGDDVTYSVAWESDGLSYPDEGLAFGMPLEGPYATIIANDTVPLGDTENFTSWVCEVTPYDGTDEGKTGSASAEMTELAVMAEDFHLEDVNPNSVTTGSSVSPRDYLEKVSGWYFTHAT